MKKASELQLLTDARLSVNEEGYRVIDYSDAKEYIKGMESAAIDGSYYAVLKPSPNEAVTKILLNQGFRIFVNHLGPIHRAYYAFWGKDVPEDFKGNRFFEIGQID